MSNQAATQQFRQLGVVVTDRRVAVIERMIPGPAAGEVLLRLDRIGVCSSDIHIMAGRKSCVAGILGHEGAGTVVAVGPEVVGWAEGDFAIVYPLLNCGRCAACERGMGHICRNRQIVGYNGRGIMVDQQVLEARALFHPPSGLPRKYGCFVEPLACVVHAQDMLGPEPERSQLILGAGPMGILHAAYAKWRGVDSVWVVDSDKNRLDLARRTGVPADEWIHLDHARERVEELSFGDGAGVTVIANSVRAGHELSFELTSAGGQVLGFASILDRPGPLQLLGGEFDSDEAHRQEHRIVVLTDRGDVEFVGAIGFDYGSFCKSADLVCNDISVEGLVTAVIQLNEVPEVYSSIWQRHLKIIIEPASSVTPLGNSHGVSQ